MALWYCCRRREINFYIAELMLLWGGGVVATWIMFLRGVVFVQALYFMSELVLTGVSIFAICRTRKEKKTIKRVVF